MVSEHDTGEPPALAAVPDLLTEVHRLDLRFWGNTRTAAVLRCVAAAAWREGRPAKVSGIAATLDFGLATVHSHLLRLSHWTEPTSGASAPLVERVNGGYRLTDQGDAQMRRWAAAVTQRMAHFRPPRESAPPSG